MSDKKTYVYFKLTSHSSLDDTAKLLKEDTSIKGLKLFNDSTLIFYPELDEKFEIIFTMQEEIANLFPSDIPYSLDYYTCKKNDLEADKEQEVILLFGHSDNEKVNNYKLTKYFKDRKLYESIPKDKNLDRLQKRYWDKFEFFLRSLTDNEIAPLKQGMYIRFKMTFNDIESASKEDYENIFNTIKNLKKVCYIGKTMAGFIFVAYMEDPSYDHILNKEIAENRYYKYDDIIKPQILEFCHDLIETIKNNHKINSDYNLAFATTNVGSFETITGGIVIVKKDSSRPFMDICCCPKNNLEIDETVIDDETDRFEEYYHRVLSR